MPLKSFLIIGLAFFASDCESRRTDTTFTLIEKGPYQALYDADGRLQRLVYDANGDGRAEVVTFFGPSGKPLRAEIDSDGDGVVDRWEGFSPTGVLEKVGLAHGKDGTPDEWDYVDATGAVIRRELVQTGGPPARPGRRLDR